LILCTVTEKVMMKKMGYRGRGYGRNYPGNGPFRDLPPWQRPGWLYGAGAGVMAATDPYTCQRFPWLPRGWWAYTDMKPGQTLMPSAEQSKQIIGQQIAEAESHIAALRKRLAELESGEKAE
jgi:hypothetical protein